MWTTLLFPAIRPRAFVFFNTPSMQGILLEWPISQPIIGLGSAFLKNRNEPRGCMPRVSRTLRHWLNPAIPWRRTDMATVSYKGRVWCKIDKPQSCGIGGVLNRDWPWLSTTLVFYWGFSLKSPESPHTSMSNAKEWNGSRRRQTKDTEAPFPHWATFMPTTGEMRKRLYVFS